MNDARTCRSKVQVTPHLIIVLQHTEQKERYGNRKRILQRHQRGCAERND